MVQPELVHEGTRSCTGKLLPPGLGLMSYGPMSGRSDDILLQGVSICLDQLHEITEYAAYARGAEKTPEGAGSLQLHQGAGGTQPRKIYVLLPEGPRCASTSAQLHGERPRIRPRNGLRCRRCRSRWPGGFCGDAGDRDGLVSALLLTTPRARVEVLDQLHHNAAAGTY